MSRVIPNAHRQRWHRGRIGVVLVVAALFCGLSAAVPGVPEEAGISPRFIQTALKELGHYNGGLDGRIGPGTRAAVGSWQESAGFPRTGTLTDEQKMELVRQSAAAGLAAGRDLLDSLRASGVLADEPPSPSDSERIDTLEQVLDGLDQSLKTVAGGVDGLDQSLKTVAGGVDGNRQAIADLGARLDAELKRLDPIALHLDSLAERMQQSADTVENQQTRIEDNSVKLYETLMGIDSAQRELEELRRAQLRAQQAASASEADASRSAGSLDYTDLHLLLSVALCMLLPFAVILYQGDFGGIAPAADAPEAVANRPAPVPGAWVVAAWFGGGVGYYLSGVGIMFGASQAGWIGAPAHFFSELLMSAPADVAPELLRIVIFQTLLAGIVSVVVCSGAVERISPWGHLFVALIVGGLVYPLFGHWTGASTFLPEQYGWLSSTGFVYSAGTTGVALLGGVTALSLARGLGRTDSRTQRENAHPAASGTPGVVLLWVAWPGVILAAAADDPSLPVLLLAASMTVAAAAMSVLLFDGLFSSGPRWHQRIPGAALAGLVAAPGAYADASTGELLLLGALAGLSYTLLMRPLSKRRGAGIELAATLAAGGLWGTLAPALFGPDGLLFVRSIDHILPQLLGLGAVLVLAVAAGRLLAWPARHIALLRTKP